MARLRKLLGGGLLIWLLVGLIAPTYAQDPLIIPLPSQVFDLRWQGDDFWTVTPDPINSSSALTKWDGATGDVEVQLSYPADAKYTWSHAGQQVVAHYSEGMALLDTATGATIWSTADATPPDVVVWSDDDTQLLTLSYDEGIGYIRDLATGAPLITLTPPAGLLGEARWSPDGTHILTLTTSTANWLNVWDASTGGSLLEHDFMTADGFGGVDNAFWNGDGTRLLTVGNTLALLDATTGDVVLQQERGQYTFKPQWSPDKMRVLVVEENTTIFPVWDTATNTILYTIQPEAGESWRFAEWSPDGAHIVAYGFDGLAIFDATSGERLGATQSTWGLTPIFQWSPDGRFIAVQGASTQLMIVDGTSGALLHTLAESTAGVNMMGPMALAWSADGSQLAAIGGQGVVVWDAASGTVIADLPVALSQPAEGEVGVSTLQFHPAGDRLLINIGSFFGGANGFPTDIQVWAVPQ